MDIGIILIGIFLFFVLVVGLIMVYFLWKRFTSLVKFEKELREGKSHVLVQTFIPIKKMTVEDAVGGDPVVFVREDLKPGEKLEFIYPASQEKAKLTVEGEENFTMEREPKA